MGTLPITVSTDHLFVPFLVPLQSSSIYLSLLQQQTARVQFRCWMLRFRLLAKFSLQSHACRFRLLSAAFTLCMICSHPLPSTLPCTRTPTGESWGIEVSRLDLNLPAEHIDRSTLEENSPRPVSCVIHSSPGRRSCPSFLTAARPWFSQQRPKSARHGPRGYRSASGARVQVVSTWQRRFRVFAVRY